MRQTSLKGQALTRTLPEPRGPLSAAVIIAISQRPPSARLVMSDADEADPYGDDLALALYTCYELHYRGFVGVDPMWEWEPGLLAFRAAIEQVFLGALRRDTRGGELGAALDELLVEKMPGNGVSHYLRDHAQWWQIREYVAHRSVYHLKEADPHTWVIPRLQGQAKAALVAVQFDEFGGGRAEQMHAQLFADLMVAAGLCADYLHYLDDVPAPAIAIVNLMSMCGLHRRLRGALVGHFAATEITTSPSAHRIVQALTRLNAAPACLHFYTEHIEADAVHELVLRRDVIGDLLRVEPQLAADVVFGVAATELLETRLAEHLLSAWRAGTTSLRRPLAAHLEAS